MRLLLPLILLLLGTGGGVAAALFLAPSEPEELAEDLPHEEGEPAEAEHVGDATHDAAEAEEDHSYPEGTDTEYAKLNNQFVIPVVREGRVEALVVLSLSVEVLAGEQEAVFRREPRLRNALLQVMFNHSNLGGFEGNFTSARNMDSLRTALTREARAIVGPEAVEVLITDIVRQDTAS